MSDFKKLAELTGEDRSKLKDYWDDLWGPEFAKALVTDFKPDGRKKEVAASDDTTIKKKAGLKIEKVTL